jgi:hypothetical protein
VVVDEIFCGLGLLRAYAVIQSCDTRTVTSRTDDYGGYEVAKHFVGFSFFKTKSKKAFHNWLDIKGMS